jgi:DNA polymerase III delta prime subunit
MSLSVPTLLITGPVGVGKTSTAAAVSGLLSQQGDRHACVDLPQISRAFPEREDDPWNEQLAHRNLASLWQNFSAIGVERLVVTRVLETRSLLRRIEDAVPGAQVVVVRLRAPLEVVQARIRARERDHPEWSLATTEYLVRAMDARPVEDYLIDNSCSSIDETAREVLSAVGWLAP